MKTLLTGLAFTALTAFTLSAGTICPASTAPTPFPHDPDPAATGCNVVITIAVNGSISTAVTDSTPYELSEDTLIGVLNNSPSAVTSLNISGTNIFGFDGDGICTFTFTGSGYCSASAKAGTDPQDYQGPTSTFTITNANSGTVHFNPAIAGNGGSGYFSLEEPPTANLVITPGPSGVPEPGTIFLMTGGLGLAFLCRKRLA